MGIVVTAIGALALYGSIVADYGVEETALFATGSWCPSCGERKLVFIRPYARYYCYECHRYAPKDYSPMDAPRAG